MKEMKNMKKWFIALAALALLLIPSVAMAEKETVFFCFSCHAERTGIISDTYEYFTKDTHVQRIQCTVCKNAGQVIARPHTESIAATCQSAAYCNVCKSYYGDPAEHNWGSWSKYDENQHVRTCQNSGCNQSQYADHSGGNATCSTEGTCTDCGASYKDMDNHSWVAATCQRAEYCSDCQTERGEKDPTNHVGPSTTTYTKTSETQHTPTMNYDCCGQSAQGSPEAHTPSTAATCTKAAYCDACESSYGKPDPNAHALVSHDAKAPTCTEIGWDAYVTCSRCTYSTYVEKSALRHKWDGVWQDSGDGARHYQTCKNDATHKDYAYHTETTAATCTTAAYCGVCRSNYGDPNPNKHVGSTTTSYKKISDAQHAVNLICKSCNAAIRTDAEDHTQAIAATCTMPAYCEVCRSNYGAPNPTAHSWGSRWWDSGDGKQHYQVCENHVTHKLYAPHTKTRPATCTAGAYCEVCRSNYGEPDPNAHDLVSHSAQAPTCTEPGWNAYITCKRCDYSTYAEKKALGHNLTSHAAQAPTCTDHGWSAYITCKRCDYTTYSEKKPLGHNLTSHAAQAPTCTEPGWSAYITCKRCDYTTYQELPALGHLYGEWISNADGTDTSSCVRGCGSRKTVVRTNITAMLPTAKATAAEITLSPVSGEVSDGTKLALVEDATAEAVNKRLPAGEAIVRMGALESGDTLLSVAFESDGKLTRPSGQVNISLPAELLEGHTLALIGEDGTETPIDFEVEEDIASFVLDFSDSLTPACLIRLVPEA